MTKFTSLVRICIISAIIASGFFLTLYFLGGFNAINYFYTILEFDTITETWREVANMRSARASPGVSIIDFNHVENFVSDCYSGTFLSKTCSKLNPFTLKRHYWRCLQTDVHCSGLVY